MDIAIAFWGEGAVHELGLHALAAGSRILLNATSGACNPDELARLLRLAPAVDVRHCARLHAKVVCGREIAVVGSANASRAGLGFSASESEGWIEAAVTVDDPKTLSEISGWYRGLWKNSHALSEELMREAEALWVKRAAAERLAAKGKATSYRIPPGGVYIALLSTEAEPGVIKAAEKSLRANGFAGASAFQGWPGIPKDATIISLEADPSLAEVKFERVWRSLPEPRVDIPFGKSRRRVYAVVPEVGIELSSFGFAKASLISEVRSLGLAMRNRRTEAKELFEKMGAEFNDEADWCLSLADFAFVADRFLRRS
ncbi:MAG: phospholipase D family protein [Xanthomonadales bacterium]|nr:phospholipase D family protein [Xanthomonadales bacterium]